LLILVAAIWSLRELLAIATLVKNWSTRRIGEKHDFGRKIAKQNQQAGFLKHH
jgi:hypothetical protein